MYIESDVRTGFNELGMKLPGLSNIANSPPPDKLYYVMEHGQPAPNNDDAYGLSSYFYDASSGAGFGEIFSIGNSVLRANQWYCIEQYINLGTPGVANGSATYLDQWQQGLRCHWPPDAQQCGLTPDDDGCDFLSRRNGSTDGTDALSGRQDRCKFVAHRCPARVDRCWSSFSTWSSFSAVRNLPRLAQSDDNERHVLRDREYSQHGRTGASRQRAQRRIEHHQCLERTSPLDRTLGTPPPAAATIREMAMAGKTRRSRSTCPPTRHSGS